MQTLEFLQEILGVDGARALKKACDDSEDLSSVLIPRTILSWVSTIIDMGYEGEVPGIENSHIKLIKNEDNYSGNLIINDSIHEFNNESISRIAATIGVVLGIGDETISKSIKGSDLSKLGKTIDLLIKNTLAKELLNPSKKKKKKINKDDTLIGGGEGATDEGVHEGVTIDKKE